MFQLTPTHMQNSLCYYRPLLLAILVAALAGCGGGQATSVSTATDSAVDNSAEFGLPSLHELVAGDSRSTSITEDTDPVLTGDSYEFSGGHVVMSGGGNAQVHSLAEGMAYAIYRFADLAVEDKLVSVTVDATTVAGAAFEYYLLYSDYNANAWKTASRQQSSGSRTMGIEGSGGVVSSIGTMYVALLAYDSAALEALSVTGHFNFFGRHGIDHFESSLPGSDAVGTAIHFDLQAVDAGGQPVAGFTRQVTLNSSQSGMSVVSQPNFVAGIAQAIISFSDAGNYSVFLDDVGVPPSGTLGTVKVYESALPIYLIDISTADLASLDANPWSDDYFSAEVTLEGQQFAGVRVRYRGGVTRNMPKKSWKVKLNADNLYADPDWGYDNKTLNLNAEYSDPTLLRDKLCYDVLQDLNVLSPHARFVHLRVNGVFQGVYTQVEQPRTDWLSSLGINPDGPLYEAKASKLEELALPIDYASVFDKELNESEPFDDLAGFVSEFNNWPELSFHDNFLATVDADNYLNYMLANTLISQGDHIMKNYLLYLDEVGTGKWYIVAWDNDLTWGHNWSEELELFDLSPSYSMPIDYGSFSSSWSGGTWGNHLMDRWLNDAAFYAEYKVAIADALDNYFTEAGFIGRVDAAYNLILPDATADPQKYTDGIAYSTWVEELREYVRQRRAFLANAIL